MPQSLSQIIVHVVFSTKDRRPFLNLEVRPRAHAYLATVARNLGCEAYRVGGVADHVHLAVRLSRTVTVAQPVEEVKVASSKWLKEQDTDLRNVAWQRGYSAFSVSPSQMSEVVDYVANQEEHHRHRTFQDEYRLLLQRHGVEFEERYVRG